MGCGMSVWLVCDDPGVAQTRLHAANLLINVAEQELSRFRPESGLNRLNSMSGQPVKVSPLLWQVLTTALDAAKATGGLYDPTVLKALESAGYRTSFENMAGREVPLPTPQTPVRSPFSWRDIRLDHQAQTVTLPEGVGIDLGGIAKGWVAHQAAQSLSGAGPCLVDAGGDIAATGTPPEMEGWPVGVADPFRPDSDLAILSVTDHGVATSGVDYRRWTAGGTPQHHIIDPRTGCPARTDILTVTVIAADAVQADLHAKVALILGASPGGEYLAGLTGVEGILVLQDGSNTTTSGLERYLLNPGTNPGGSI